MNRNDIKEQNPVYISRATIQAYKERYEDTITKAWSPGGFSYMGAACEAEYVLTALFRVPQEDITEMMTRAMKKSNEEKEKLNESQTNS